MCIQVQQITYIHPDKEVLFRNLCFTVGKGRQLALIGNNGCGKSTLLQIMAGKLQPSSGNVLRPDDLYYVPQHFGQYDEMSIAQALGIDRKQKALHEILYWDRSNRFCPTCGTPLVQKEPIMKKCPNCGREIYPVISTAILVLVRKEDSLLLVHAHNFKGTFNSLVAGFLETGETLEECVAREVKEETGLDVKNIRYFGSQPWPYPSGLMVGFIADYASGDIHLQDDELSSGNFYTRDHLPELPRKLSLARKMIDWWIAQQ
jgi:NADH pyrophosphatase NudC (nudix superfamily)